MHSFTLLWTSAKQTLPATLHWSLSLYDAPFFAEILLSLWHAHSSMSLSIILSATIQTMSKINLFYKTMHVFLH